MKSEPMHISERELVLSANGELQHTRRTAVSAHLDSCWQCRERADALQSTISDFVRARNQALNESLADERGPQALLRARMAQAAVEVPRWRWPAASAWRFAVAGAAFVAVLLAVLVTFESKVNAEGPKPRWSLTPGETRPMTLDEVCLYSKAEVISRDIPEDKRQQVFALYGIKSPGEGQFEVDYLITPDLGGTESVRNLWPQPYSARWNAT